MLQSLFICRWLLTVGTVIPVNLIAVSMPKVQEKSVFYGYLSAASVSVGLPTQFVDCCLVTARAFVPASLILIPYTIQKFIGQQLPLTTTTTIEPEYSLASLGIRVSDQLSDRLIFGRLFQANERFSTFRSCANL